MCCITVLTGCNSKRNEVVPISFNIEGNKKENSTVILQGSVNGVKIAGERGVVVTVSDEKALKLLIENNQNGFFDITAKGKTYFDVTFKEVITDGEFLIMDVKSTIQPKLDNTQP